MSRNGANPCSCEHCFHVVRVCRWSKMWSNAVFCADHIFIFSKRYTHVRVYSFKGSLAYYRELVKSFAEFLSINILKCSFVFQFCTLKLYFKNTRKLFPFATQNLIRSKQRKGNLEKLPYTMYSIKVGKIEKFDLFSLDVFERFCCTAPRIFHEGND